MVLVVIQPWDCWPRRLVSGWRLRRCFLSDLKRGSNDPRFYQLVGRCWFTSPLETEFGAVSSESVRGRQAGRALPSGLCEPHATALVLLQCNEQT